MLNTPFIYLLEIRCNNYFILNGENNFENVHVFIEIGGYTIV